MRQSGARLPWAIAVLVTAVVLTACDASTLGDETPQQASSTSQSQSQKPAGNPEPKDAFKPISLHGTGNKVARFRIPRSAAAVAEISHSGSSNFAVWTIGQGGDRQDLLVNEIGGYRGTVLFDEQDGQHSVAFQIAADGRWTVRILPLSRAPVWSGRKALNGRGDTVIRLNPPSSGLTTTKIQHTGSSNFAVYAYGDTTELLVNEIGRYRGESLLPNGTLLIAITADGRWSFSKLE
jgi:hypothetical protein